MSIETIQEVVEWLKVFRSDPVTFTFHGGEPLLAGADFYRKALPLLTEGLADRRVAFALQTNLWRLTPELAKIFAEYNIPIGSSIDGPKELNDLQRSEGYFDKTMHGHEIARASGLNVQFICTFTSYSVNFKEDILNFFLENGLTLKFHPALPSLRGSEPDKWALDPVEYGELLVYLLDRYLEKMDEIDVRNIDDLLRCVLTSRGTVCTYVDCMDDTFAVGPDGSIYPCYRFVGMPEWVMGDVYNHPKKDDLAESDAWKRMQQFKEYVNQHCKGCNHIRYCRGGCPYNAIAPTGGEIKGVDPHCIAYKRIFDEITDRLNREFFGGPGLEVCAMPFEPVKDAKPGIKSLMQKMMRSP
jgi:uncharacterized protein